MMFKETKARAAKVKGKALTKTVFGAHQKNYRYIVGIDAGTHTGFAVYDRVKRELVRVDTLMIHEAFKIVEMLIGIDDPEGVFFRVEDARKRKWYGANAAGKMQGAGSVKRDCSIWEDYLTSMKADFEMVAPAKGATKWNAETFKNVTKWQSRTSEHSRDAAVLCFGR